MYKIEFIMLTKIFKIISDIITLLKNTISNHYCYSINNEMLW